MSYHCCDGGQSAVDHHAQGRVGQDVKGYMQRVICGSSVFGVVPDGGWVEGHAVVRPTSPIMAFNGLNPAPFIYTGIAT